MRCLLVANRGEIACRIQRTAQAMGLRTVAAYTDDEANALHVRMASAAVRLDAARPTQAHLDIAGVLAAALRSGADAVHPGYGFLSENADFAQAVIAAGLTWVGPPPAAMRALGDKARAKRLALKHGVPCLPGYSGDDQSDAAFIAAAQALGMPLMIKAVAGGGGRGMRLVQTEGELVSALQAARSEALSAFGCGDLLLERALHQVRHIEVQVFADQHGAVIHLGERECSLQRRHQKLVEEAPSPAVDAALRQRMGEAAVRLAAAAGYVGAGTVEFLVEFLASGEAAFYFMEMNTRLQVEHPVTEAVTGIDLVEWQLRIAQGEALPLGQSALRLSGHAIEARLCAEDDDFIPQTGAVLQLQLPAVHRQLRLEHALELGSRVGPHFDSMLGKWIAVAQTRAQALQRLQQALRETALLGLTTNRAWLCRLLAQADVQGGELHVNWLDEQSQALRADVQGQRAAAGVMVALLVDARGKALEHGLALTEARPLRWRWRGVALNGHWQNLGGGQLHCLIDDQTLAVQVLQVDAGDQSGCVRARWQAGDQTHEGSLHWVHTAAKQWHAQFVSGPWAGVECWLSDVSLHATTAAGARWGDAVVRSPCSGKILRCPVQPGESVQAGDTLVVIESMKLEHSVRADGAAQLARVSVVVGQQVSPGQVLAELKFHPVTPGAAVTVQQPQP